MPIGIAEFVRIYSGGTTYQRWQNFYIGQTINSYTHLPFETDGVRISDSGNDTSISITMAATTEAVAAINAAIENGYFVEMLTYQVPDPTGDNLPGNAVLLGTYTGEALEASSDFMTITMEVGISLSAVGAQVPWLRYTPAMVGTPCRL